MVDSVTSVEAHEQETRREYQIRDRARVLQIPLENFESDAAIHQYVSILRDIKAAAERVSPLLKRAENRAGRPLVSDGSPERTRLGQAHHLYEGAALILEEGFASVDGLRRVETIPDTIRSITRYLDSAAKPLGLRVAEADPHAVWRDDYKPRQPIPAEGVWTGGEFMPGGLEAPWDRGPNKDYEWFWPDEPNERHDPEHLRVLAEEARQYGFYPTQPEVDPKLHTLLSGLVYGKQIVDEVAVGRSLPPPPGLTPSADARLAQVSSLVGLALVAHEDALKPGSLTPERFNHELAPVIAAFDLRIKADA